MPNQDRSIRNINLRHKHPQPEPVAPVRTRKPRRRNKHVWWLALGVAGIAAVLGLFLSTVFAGAAITLTPRAASVTLPSTILAQLDAPVGVLSYQTLSVTQSATTTVPAKGTEHVSRQASGGITITNSYNSASQRLIANTRFQAPDGKIYRIRDSVVVPGVSGGNAGSVSATAYADSPGPDYNRSGNTTYTIPGFKGDPRYSKITASSNAMSGGFIGDQPAVAAADLQKAKQQLQQELDSAVRSAFITSLPAGYQTINGEIEVTLGDVVQTVSSGDTATLSQTSTGNANIVRINDLAAAVAKQTVSDYKGEAITFADPAGVSVSATTTKQANALQLQLNGQTTLVWIFDPNALKAALVGKQKSDFESVIKSFEPAIAKADASIRPFWTSTFPADSSNISITVKIGQ